MYQKSSTFSRNWFNLSVAILVALLTTGVLYAKRFSGSHDISLQNQAQIGGVEKISSTTSECEGVQSGSLFTFDIHPGLPVYTLKFFQSSRTQNKYTHPVVISCIEVFRGDDSYPVQTLSDFYAPPITGKQEDNFIAEDANFDGYQDVVLRTWIVGGNTSYTFWLFRSKQGVFELNENLSDLPNPTMHEKNKRITTHLNTGCAGDCFEDSMYVFEEGNLVLVRRVIQELSSDQTHFIKMTKERVGDHLETVRTEAVSLSSFSR